MFMAFVLSTLLELATGDEEGPLRRRRRERIRVGPGIPLISNSSSRTGEGRYFAGPHVRGREGLSPRGGGKQVLLRGDGNEF